MADGPTRSLLVQIHWTDRRRQSPTLSSSSSDVREILESRPQRDIAGSVLAVLGAFRMGAANRSSSSFLAWDASLRYFATHISQTRNRNFAEPILEIYGTRRGKSRFLDCWFGPPGTIKKLIGAGRIHAVAGVSILCYVQAPAWSCDTARRRLCQNWKAPWRRRAPESVPDLRPNHELDECLQCCNTRAARMSAGNVWPAVSVIREYRPSAALKAPVRQVASSKESVSRTRHEASCTDETSCRNGHRHAIRPLRPRCMAGRTSPNLRRTSILCPAPESPREACRFASDCDNGRWPTTSNTPALCRRMCSYMAA